MIQHCKEKNYYIIILSKVVHIHALLIGPHAEGGVLFYYYY